MMSLMAGYWLVKSEPDVYSIDDLQRDGRTHWDGVRNYQARNLLRDQMKVGDLVLFHHSSSNPPAIAGLARVVREGYPDFTAWDSGSPYFDSASTPAAPRWFMVDLEFVEKFPRPVGLNVLRSRPELGEMALLKQGRLSVLPVRPSEFEVISALAKG